MKNRRYIFIGLHDLSKVIDSGRIIFNKIESISKYTDKVILIGGCNYFDINSNLKIQGKICDLCNENILNYLYASREIIYASIKKKSIFKNKFVKIDPLFIDFCFDRNYFNLDKNIKFYNSKYNNIEVLNTIFVSREKYEKG